MITDQICSRLATIIKEFKIHFSNKKGFYRSGFFGECIGRTVVGNSSKIHMISDSCGNPIDFIVSKTST